MIIVCGSPRNKMWIVWRKPQISPPTWKLFCCVLLQQQNYSAVSSPNSRTLLLCPPPSHQKTKRNSEISELFFSKIVSCPICAEKPKMSPPTAAELSRVECPSPAAELFCCALPQQQNFSAVFPPPLHNKKKTRLQKSVIYFESEGLGQDTTELFCCDFPQEQNYSAVDSAVSFPNLSEISDFFYPELVLFPLKWKPNIPPSTTK